MHTPTKAQWQTVIDNFVRVLPLAKREDHLSMLQTTLCSPWHPCGTVHCVGGWYGISALEAIDNRIYTSYTKGAEKMAQDLGFSRPRELTIWAYNNSEIWGNNDGPYMFSEAAAYDGAKNLHEVIAFLEKVRDRSPE